MPPPPVFFFSFFLFLLTHRMSELRGPPPGHYASRHLRERHRPASCQYCHVLWSSAPTLCVSMRRLDSGLHPRANRGSGPLRLFWASGGGQTRVRRDSCCSGSVGDSVHRELDWPINSGGADEAEAAAAAAGWDAGCWMRGKTLAGVQKKTQNS